MSQTKAHVLSFGVGKMILKKVHDEINKHIKTQICARLYNSEEELIKIFKDPEKNLCR